MEKKYKVYIKNMIIIIALCIIKVCLTCGIPVTNRPTEDIADIPATDIPCSEVDEKGNCFLRPTIKSEEDLFSIHCDTVENSWKKITPIETASTIEKVKRFVTAITLTDKNNNRVNFLQTLNNPPSTVEVVFKSLYISITLVDNGDLCKDKGDIPDIDFQITIPGEITISTKNHDFSDVIVRRLDGLVTIILISVTPEDYVVMFFVSYDETLKIKDILLRVYRSAGSQTDLLLELSSPDEISKFKVNTSPSVKSLIGTKKVEVKVMCEVDSRLLLDASGTVTEDVPYHELTDGRHFIEMVTVEDGKGFFYLSGTSPHVSDSYLKFKNIVFNGESTSSCETGVTIDELTSTLLSLNNLYGNVKLMCDKYILNLKTSNCPNIQTPPSRLVPLTTLITTAASKNCIYYPRITSKIEYLCVNKRSITDTDHGFITGIDPTKCNPPCGSLLTCVLCNGEVITETVKGFAVKKCIRKCS
ncbi:MAG: hypothetical protein KatS3mg101_0887 [Patescibacteria group bacterium]|nr:MAG: hypothetical protein KatS3mg101_0887 [Patescibacteria group bacterium]